MIKMDSFLRKALFVDAFGQQIDGEFLDKLRDIQRKEKPICIAWDGMSLVDDVGGVGGFCEFLETINGDNPEEKKSYKNVGKESGMDRTHAKTRKHAVAVGIFAHCFMLHFRSRRGVSKN